MTRQQRRKLERKYEKSLKERINFIKNNQWSDDEVEGTEQIKQYLLNFNFAIHRENRYKKELNENTSIEQIMTFL